MRGSGGSKQREENAIWKTMWSLKIPNVAKCSCGELVKIFYLLKQIYYEQELSKKHCAPFVGEMKKWSNTFYGAAHPLRMCGVVGQKNCKRPLVMTQSFTCCRGDGARCELTEIEVMTMRARKIWFFDRIM